MSAAPRTARFERGSALVEFALVTTAAFTMMFGIVDFGRALYTNHLVSNAARSGSRYAMVHGSTCSLAGCPATATQIQTYVRGLAVGIDTTQLTVTPTYATGPGCADPSNKGAGCAVTVTVTYPFKFLVPMLPHFTMQMTSASTMIISQ